jgi:L-iditol 2-dehydrogenase
LRLGHEIYGTVEDTTKPELQNKKVVVFPDIHCGTCVACQNGIITACSNFSNIGFERAGGFAEYVAIPDINLLKVPETVDPQVANLTEPLACGLHAIEIAGLKKNDNVLVLGVGPIGLLITYICSKEFASNTLACDISSFRRKIAREMGASSTIKPDELKSQDLFPDVVFDCTGGLSQSINQTIDIIRPRGTICVEGSYEGKQHIGLRKLQMKEARIVTSQGNNLKNRQDAISKIELHANELKPLITHTYPLEKISEAFYAAVKHYETNAVKILVKQ